MAFDPNVPKKKCLYTCPQCGEEWVAWVPIEERKLRRWCPRKVPEPRCGILVSPRATEQKQVRERVVRVTRPKPLW
jgi:hypothetical protein